ncbi:MAG: glycosyltransferase family 4 protein [Candidatus Fermentibacteraceae bacterium]|nr:glycosyltransferase family 4 protein [Candidatus Fermentibacteraceae bacterium]MBN2607625.1 glycosyltransferase family 4 protein [Candidatus Fermentibacteraceae bacterium]
MSGERTEALLVTPLPPMETGLATYAVRVLEHTRDSIRWTVAFPGKADIQSLPEGPSYIPIDALDPDDVPERRIFQLGNSVHCFPVLQTLYVLGGTVLFHETVIHHMIRYCCLEQGRVEDYRRELRFCFGPGAGRVERILAAKGLPDTEYDSLLKRYPLIGRAVNASHSAVCLNEYAAGSIRGCYPPGAVITVGHPLSPVPELAEIRKPFPVCLGMVGSFHPGRNLPDVLRAMEIIRCREPNAGLLLIGGGYPEDLPPWAMATGRVPEREYQSWIRVLDCVLDLRHPTCGETSGSLLEAMRAGIPPIVSASGAFINLPSDAVIRISPDNIVQALPAAFDILRRDDRLRTLIGRGAADHANATGSVERLERDWERVIELAGTFSRAIVAERSPVSMAPAWVDPPQGFERDLFTGPVTWKFSDGSILTGPAGCSGGFLTAWGGGSVNGVRLPDQPAVIAFEGEELLFNGSGRISDVFWK